MWQYAGDTKDNRLLKTTAHQIFLCREIRVAPATENLGASICSQRIFLAATVTVLSSAVVL